VTSPSTVARLQLLGVRGRSVSLWLRLGGYGLVAAAAAVYATWRTFGNFSYYDDEGYVLLSIKEFMQRGHLYSHVYTQYGPFPYEFWALVFKVLGGDVTPERARIIVIVMWVVMALLIGLITEWVSGSFVAGLVATMVGLTTLAAITSEPLTPDDLSALIGVLILASTALFARHRGACLAVLGLLGAAAITTKINIGGAMVLATLLAVAVTDAPRSRRGRQAVTVLAGIGVVMPFAVMRDDLTTGSDPFFAVTMALGIAALGVTLRNAEPAPGSESDGPWWSDVLRYLLWLVAGVVFVVAVITATGTAPSDLIRGMVIWPLSLRSIFSASVSTNGAAVVLGVLSLIWSVLHARAVKRAAPISERSAWVDASLRLVVSVVIVLTCGTLDWLPEMAAIGPLAICLPFMWLVANPPRRSERATGHRLNRVLLAALPLYAAIGVYPVAGSQYGYALTLFVPGVVVILADACREIRRLADHRDIHLRYVARAIIAAAVLFVVVQFIVRPGLDLRKQFYNRTPLEFAGAASIRQPPRITHAFQDIVAALRANCTHLVMIPGADSFYLWANIAPPTGLNAGDWMYLLKNSQQQATVDAVEHEKNLCLVSNIGLIEFWEQGRSILPEGPLYRFMQRTHWTAILRKSGYTVSVRRPNDKGATLLALLTPPPAPLPRPPLQGVHGTLQEIHVNEALAP
jgi:hypothetical protein